MHHGVPNWKVSRHLSIFFIEERWKFQDQRVKIDEHWRCQVKQDKCSQQGVKNSFGSRVLYILFWDLEILVWFQVYI